MIVFNAMPVMETQRVCPLVTDGIKAMRRHVQHVWDGPRHKDEHSVDGRSFRR